MPSAPRVKPRVRTLVVTGLILAIAVSWVASTGVEHYMNYLQILRVRKFMSQHPELYGHPVIQPIFGPAEFFLGYPARLPIPDAGSSLVQQEQPSFTTKDLPPGLPLPLPDEKTQGLQRVEERRNPLTERQVQYQLWTVGVVIAVALALGLLFGFGVAMLLTRPLRGLTAAAREMTHGNYRAEIPDQVAYEFIELGQTLRFLGDRVSAQIAELEHETQTRRQFLADIAHEFRTPLTTLHTMAGAIEDGLADDPARRERAIGSIRRTSARLLRLVTDMLELARLDLKELPLRMQTVDARELAMACRTLRLYQAEAAGIELEPVPQGEPALVEADPDRLAQIFDNLISNAISYAGEGARVSIRFSDHDEVVRITVADTGRGIAARHQPYLGEAFYRADAARSPGDDHSGLGLRIVRALIQAQGGAWNLVSQEGAGTSATISLKKPI